MSEFDRIIDQEKQRHYRISDQDQFVFDTLSLIEAKRSRTLKLALIALATILSALVLFIQMVFVTSASFTELGASLQHLLTQKPYYLALFNAVLITVILLIKRIRLFG